MSDSTKSSGCCGDLEETLPVVVHRPTVTVGGHFELIDHFGQQVTENSYLGRRLLIFFGFTHCRTICPAALSRMDEALDLLGEKANDVQPLYVSVDPERDTPAVLRAFLQRAHPRFVGLTGSAEQVAAAQAAYHVFAGRAVDPDDSDGYQVPHSAFTYLMGQDGAYITHFTDAVTAAEMARRLAGSLGRHKSIVNTVPA
ncbi:hypothetical protein GCM10010174_34600 [Kutzneria viridogrisea]|uniref:Protein SCO1/2 n=1 Tax=Kutzneria viridogrisea TaxID=47990 RepID=A0ABR6BIR4_9PSEU|nr:protein SCO1/2 [Kutzneria viridogrisea]